MDSSKGENCGRKKQAPTAAELLAFANAQKSVAGVKRTADEVPDLEVPEGSRPMLALDSNRHRPNNSELLEASSTPLESLRTLVAPSPTRNSLSSTITSPPAAAVSPPAAAVSPPASSKPRLPNSDRAPSQTITSLSGIDRESPIIQSMLREAFNEGRSEGRQEIKAKLDEMESKVEEVRKKASNDRLAFESICKEKDQGIHDQQMAMSRYQMELTARRRLINDLKQQASGATPQDPTHSQNISNQQMLDAEARFGAQGQELAIAKSQNELMRAQLINWQVQWGLINADLKKSKAAFSTKSSELDACQHQLNITAHELKKSKEEASQLAVENSEQIGSLKAANTTLIKDAADWSKSQNELMTAQLINWQAQWGLIDADLKESKAAFSTKASELDACQRQLDIAAHEINQGKEVASQLAVEYSEQIGSLKAANTTLTKDVADSSAKLESVMALNEELRTHSKQVEDGKDDEINTLTSENNELIKLRGDLKKAVTQQDEELQQLSAENKDLTRKLEEKEEMDERASLSPSESQIQADDHQVEEIDNLPAELAPETAAADIELVRVMLERERVKTEAENARRENRMTAHLEGMEESEQRRRQILLDELEDNNAQLHDAQKQIKELTKRLLAASPTQSPPSAPSSSAPPPIISPAPNTQPPPPTAAPSPPPQPNSWFRLPRRVPATNAGTNISPRRLLIMILIFLLAFLVPYLHSLSRPAATENTNSGQVTIEVLPAEEVISTSEAYEDGRRRWQAHAMANWERNERIARGEAPSKWDEEYRPFPGYP